MTSMVAAHLAVTGQLDQLASLCLGVAALDQTQAGTAGRPIIDQRTADAAMAVSTARGVPGRALPWPRCSPGCGRTTWIWNYYWVNNYLQGKTPPAFDILYWNADVTRLPAALHHDFLRLGLANALVTPGAATMLGSPVDLGKVDVDAYLVAGITDHLCPWESCYRTTQLLGGPVKFVLSTSGHIAAMVNPPTNPKAAFRTAPAAAAAGAPAAAAANAGAAAAAGVPVAAAAGAPAAAAVYARANPPDPREFLATATTVPGSWWTDYAAWLAADAAADSGRARGRSDARPTRCGPPHPERMFTTARVRSLAVDGRQLRIAVRPARRAVPGARSHSGRRTPLLLINGIGAGLELLEHSSGRWIRTLKSSRFDPPGVGRSRPRAHPLRTGSCRAVHADREHAGTEPGHDQVDVLGISWGGAVAQHFAAFRRAPLPAKLVLVATATGSLMVLKLSAVRCSRVWSAPRRYLDLPRLRRNRW